MGIEQWFLNSISENNNNNNLDIDKKSTEDKSTDTSKTQNWNTGLFENMTTDKFNALSEKEKESTFLQFIEDLKHNPDLKLLKDQRKWLWPKEKLKYYNSGEIISVSWSLHHIAASVWPAPDPSKVIDAVKHPLNPFKVTKAAKSWISTPKTQINETMAPLFRMWVSFWILEKPFFLKESDYIWNIWKDARLFKQNLWIFEKVCKNVPQLRLVRPIVKKIEPYADRYSEKWAAIMQEKLKRTQWKLFEKRTRRDLTKVELDVEKKSIEKNSENPNWNDKK